MPQLRQNIITGEWVVFAPERAKRPTDYVSVTTEKKQKKSDCPFCIDSPVSAFDNREKEFVFDDTYLIKNKYPVFIEEPEVKNAKLYSLEDDFYKMRLALGGHDVVVCRDHDTDLADFPKQTWVDIFSTIKKRGEYFAKLTNIEYVMPIYNHGPAAAASIEHPHAQIFASTIVPNLVSRELSHSASYYSAEKSCVFCDLIKHEKRQNTRVLFENEDFLVFNFYAAKFPFETWIIPKFHQSSFFEIKPAQIESLTEICQKVFKRFHHTLNDPDLNFFIHSNPIKEPESPSYHWHMEITPRLTVYGGYELGSGMVIDIIAPEQAAEFLRIAKKDK